MFNKLISSLFSVRNQEPVTAPDPSFGFTKVKQVGNWLKHKEYGLIRQLYFSLNNAERTALLEGVCMTENYATSLRQWVQQEPNCPVAQLLNGVLCTHMAWVARTASRANQVSEQQATIFFQQLELAYAHLDKAIDLNPEEAEPYARMIRVLMGLNQAVDLLYSYFNALVERDSQHLYGHMYLLNALSHKWLGSNDEMMDFANQVAQTAPAGSLLHTLTPMAHIELWLNEEQDEVRSQHFQKKATQQAVYQAYQKSLGGHRAASPLETVMHNYFCFAFHYIGDQSLSQTERKAMGNYMTFTPWAYVDAVSVKEVDRFLRQPK